MDLYSALWHHGICMKYYKITAASHSKIAGQVMKILTNNALLMFKVLHVIADIYMCI